MKIFRTVHETKKYLRMIQGEGLRVGLVPTMGALHEGHLSLVSEAKRRSEIVVASIFVNPLQFGPTEDLARYPADLEGDREKLERSGASAVFVPSAAEMFSPIFQTGVEVTNVSQGLCGAARPTHFKGVTTIVLKLFSIIRPDVAIFGEKDYQQLTVIRTMVRDLSLDVEIVGVPIVRDADGLAMSSRNAYLSPLDRTRALSLSRGLHRADALFREGERTGARLLRAVRDEIEAHEVKPEYLELRSTSDLSPLGRADTPSLILVAAKVGSTRLIDNHILRTT